MFKVILRYLLYEVQYVFYILFNFFYLEMCFLVSYLEDFGSLYFIRYCVRFGDKYCSIMDKYFIF